MKMKSPFRKCPPSEKTLKEALGPAFETPRREINYLFDGWKG